MIFFLFHCLLFKVRIQISSVHFDWLIKLLCLFSLQMPCSSSLLSWSLYLLNFVIYLLKKQVVHFKHLILCPFWYFPMVLYWCSTEVSVFSVNWVENLIKSKFYFFMKLFCKGIWMTVLCPLISRYRYIWLLLFFVIVAAIANRCLNPLELRNGDILVPSFLFPLLARIHL